MRQKLRILATLIWKEGFCDLRHSDKKEELAFKESLHENLVLCCILLACAFLPGLWITSLPEFFVEIQRTDSPFRWSSDDPRTLMYSVHVLINLAGFGIIILGMLTLKMPQLLNFVELELFMSSIFSFIVTVSPLASYWYSSLACGVHPDNVWKGNARDGEMTVLVCVIAVVTTCCLFPFECAFCGLFPPAASSHVQLFLLRLVHPSLGTCT